MFLRYKVRRKDGKEHRYWSIVENRRVSGGRTVQRQVLYLGEIKEQAMRRRLTTPTEADPGSTADQAGSCTNGSGAGRLSDHRHPAARQGPAGHGGDFLLQAELAEAAGGTPAGRQLSAAIQSHGRRSGETLGVLSAIGGDRAGLQRTQGGPGDPPDLPPNRRAHRSPHLRGIPGLLSAGDAQAAAAGPGAGADATVGVGEDGRNPDGRHAPADHRWAHGPAVALHRARTGPVDPAPPVEDRLARSAVT